MRKDSVWRNNVNTKLSIVLVTCVILFGSACGSSRRSLILGKWEADTAVDSNGSVQVLNGQVGGKPMTVEFDEDGTAKLSMMGQTMQGAYQLDAGNELKWTMNGISTKSKANVTETGLELTDESNRTIRYRRK
jgi:hypothetical protein